MPYRIELRGTTTTVLDRLVELGALDAEVSADGSLAALMPDRVTPEEVAKAVGVPHVVALPAVGRDADSVWVLRQPDVRVGGKTLHLIDAPAFGTGVHPTTALCLEALDELVALTHPSSVLDVGTGSGILALAALTLGVPRALGIDIDDEALRVAGENARHNALADRLELALGGPETVTGTWPLVLANVLAAPLVEMAPALVRRIGRDGHLVLSGIPSSLEQDVARAYRHLGLHPVRSLLRGGWVALILRAGW